MNICMYMYVCMYGRGGGQAGSQPGCSTADSGLLCEEDRRPGNRTAGTVQAGVYACMCVCMFLCMYVCMYVSIYVCL